MVSTSSEGPRPADNLDEARRFREAYGLRADETWLREVAADPGAELGRQRYGIPLTADEVRELDRRAAGIDSIRRIVVDYGLAHPDEYAGAFIDHQRDGVLVVQFAGASDVHERALNRLVRPDAPLEVRAVRWSLRELEAFASRLDGQDGWFRSIPAVLVGYGPAISDNRVSIDVSSVVPNIEAIVEAHFGWKDVALVRSDGTGALLLESGRLRVLVVGRAGDPVEGLECAPVADLAGAYETPTEGVRTDERGICELDLPATGYWIRLERGGGPPEVVAMGRAVVRAGEVTEVTMQVP